MQIKSAQTILREVQLRRLTKKQKGGKPCKGKDLD